MISEAVLLRSLGHEVFVSAPDFPGFDLWSSQMRAIGARVISFNPPNFVEVWRWRHLRQFLSFGNSIYLRRLRIDLATVFSCDMTFCGSKAYVLHDSGIPWVISIHVPCWQYFYNSWAERQLRNAFSSMLGGYTVSNTVRESFLRYAGHLIHDAENIEVIKNGVDVSHFFPDPANRVAVRQSLGIGPENFCVVFFGRLDSNKDPLLALKIFRHLTRLCPRGRLIVLGDGVLRADVLNAVQENGLEGKVTLAGHVNDVRTYLLSADAYIACSTKEGYSLSTAEALASGLPSVLPDHGAYNECFSGSGAFFYSLDDPEGAALSLARIADSSSEVRANLQNAARVFAERELSLDTMNSRLHSFYEKCFRMI
jgi:glycosyltransferase involved in cell wall biosynthesis